MDDYEVPMRFGDWLYLEDVNGKRNLFNVNQIISIKEGKKEGVSYIYDVKGSQVPATVKIEFDDLLGLIDDTGDFEEDEA